MNQTTHAILIEQTGQIVPDTTHQQFNIDLRKPLTLHIDDEQETTITLHAPDVPTIVVKEVPANATLGLIGRAPQCTFMVQENNSLVFTRELPQAQFLIALCHKDDSCTTDETLHVHEYRVHAYIMGGPAKNLLLIDS